MAHAFVYGLHLRSNVPLPGLPQAPPDEPVDVDIHLGTPLDDVADLSTYRASYVSHVLNREGRPVVVINRDAREDGYLWTYSDGPRFLLRAGGSIVHADWLGAGTLDDAVLHLLGPILGFALRLRGVTCLHASAVAVGDRALLLLGRASFGKSTTAAALVRLGHALVSEDVVPVVERGDHYDAVPGYPAIRLWPRAVDILYGPDASLPLLTPHWDKGRLDLPAYGYRFRDTPVALGAIYCLVRRTWDDSAPAIAPGTRQQALMRLVENGYTNYALDRDMREREFTLLGALSGALPFRLVTRHRDPARLPQLCEIILRDFARLGGEDLGASATSRRPPASLTSPEP